MQKSKSKAKLQLPISVVLVCFTIAGCCAITWFSGVDFWWWLLLIPSVFLTVQATSVFHEFGHYLAIKKGGFEVYYFKCSAFTMDKYGRKKFKISLFGEHLGEIRFYPKKEVDYSKVLLKSLWAGLKGSVLIAIILNAFLILSLFGVFGKVSPYLSVAFSFAPYAVYSLIVNAIPWFHPENDASKIIQINKNESQRLAIDNFYKVQKQLFEGKTYAEMSKEFFDCTVNSSLDVKIPLMVYALRRATEIGDKNLAREISNSLQSQEYLDDETRCELLYNAIILNEESEVQKLSSVLKLDLDEGEPFVLRTRLAYAKYTKDEEYFKVLKPSAIKVCDRKNFCKGDVLYNKKLIESL